MGAFGADSLLEIAAGVVVLRRLRVEQRGQSGTAKLDRRASRVIGYLLLAVGVLVVATTAHALLTGQHPRASVAGIALALASLLIMPWIVATKRRMSWRIGSRALAADAACGVACAYMAGALLLGLALRAAFGWWWADPVAALGIVYFVAREGVESVGCGDCDEDGCCP